MIVKVIPARSDDPGGLVRYLFGRGTGEDRGLHENQRTIAGTTLAANLPDAAAVEQIAEDLRAYQRVWGATPKGGHIQHIVISLNPADRPLTDPEWRALVEDYMTTRGIADPAKADVRWTAVNHGRNAAGADHVHITLSLIRADGRVVDTWQDQPRSQTWARDAEKRHNLIPLDSRAANTRARGATQGELAKAAAAGREPIRVRLADTVRPIAAASTSEADYVQRLRAANLDPRPRVTDGKVTGYSIAADGQRFGGGTVAPELRLPALRRVQWDESNGLAAAREWQNPTPHRAAPPTADQVRAAVGELQRELWRAPMMTPDQHRAWSAQAAGLTAAAASAHADPDVRAELTALSRDLGRWAGPTTARPAKPSRRAAQVIASALGGSVAGDRTSPDDGALMDAVGSVAQIAQMHRTTRPAIATDTITGRHAQAQQIAYARHTLAPGYYRTGDTVTRVRRARAGTVYATTRQPDGSWKAGAPRNLIAAAQGQRMTPTDVAGWEKTATPRTAAPVSVPVQPVAPRAVPRRQPPRFRGR